MTKLEDNNCDFFFLKSGDSKNDQPNDNGPNACLKSCYDEEMDKWNMEWGTTTYSPAHMNKVLVETWLKFQLRAPPITVKAFKKTRLLPLLPPDEDKNLAVWAMTAAMQIGEGKKAIELSIIQTKALQTIPYSVTKTSDLQAIQKAKMMIAEIF